MRRPDRVVLLLLSILTAALAACGAGPRSPGVACSGDEQCGEAAWCVDHACVGNSPPQASLTVPDSAFSGSLAALDGTASSDPDPLDTIVTYTWTAEATSAPCDAPTIADTTPVAQVRFGCAGTFAIHLVVTDTKHAASTPATKEVTVGESGTGAVHAGADQSVQHACSGSPLRCHAASPVRLAGSVTASASGALTYEWTVQPPPNRPLDTTRRVRFTPGASVPDPTVDVETDGVAISGDWIFHLEVRDGARLLGADDMRLSIGNRPPVVTHRADPSYPHTYDATARTYRASGAVVLLISDPDGDPVSHHAEWRQTGEPGDQFSGEDHGSSVTFAIGVTAPSSLIGTSNARTIAIAADDGNGGVTADAIPILVGNRLPQLASSAVKSVPHFFDQATMTYRTSGPVHVATWVDPDGDPLTSEPASDPRCTGVVHTDGSQWLSCAAAYDGVETLALFVGRHDLHIQAGDPWGVGIAPASIIITNRAPSVGGISSSVSRACSCGTAIELCCQSIGTTCLTRGNIYAPATARVPLNALDPDGDPLQLSAASSQPLTASCRDGSCIATFSVSSVHACTTPDPLEIRVQVSDGVTLASGTVSVATSCR